jgi:hypothetical protein
MAYNCALHARCQLAGMTSLSKEVNCTIQAGALCMHLDDARVHVPSHILNESKVLLDALASACDHSLISDFTLAAPTNWLQAWVLCYVYETEPLCSAEVDLLVNCLKVRIWQFPREIVVWLQLCSDPITKLRSWHSRQYCTTRQVHSISIPSLRCFVLGTSREANMISPIMNIAI